jgi:hypothetical protein
MDMSALTSSVQQLPGDATLQHAARMGISEEKPIMLDYWLGSLSGKTIVGVKSNGEKMLVKSEDEYTSPIAKFFKLGDNFIVITENSIYIVSATIPTRKISG